VEQVGAILMKLNLATRQFHADVDEPWLALLDKKVAVADYLNVLVRTYGLLAPFESACRYTTGIPRVVDGHFLQRAGLIAQDLLTLGLSPMQVAVIPTCPDLTIFRSIGEALGWLYVVERSTLLQDGIRRHLLQTLPQVEPATSYLATYEGRANEHWLQLGRLLDHAISSADVEREALESATNAFATCRTWLRRTSSIYAIVSSG
jgi:heme oxygenase